MKKLLSYILRILSLIAIVILTIAFYVLIGFVQEKLFAPKEYLLWIFKYPVSRLVFIYELFIGFGFFYLFNKGFRESFSNNVFFKRHRVSLLSAFVLFNIILLYTIITDVTVITNKKIIDYSFLSPQGKEHSYHDVAGINTGVYGKKFYVPFTHSKGDFYYIIKLNDGTRIDLTEMGGAKNDIDERFIIEKLDIQFVNMGIPKTSSMANFKYSTLGKIYNDKIRNILQNTK
ncbi:hypothetical protein [Neobacillus ginsengisoli]|uniref:Uncharacterized protein n=1 Tax=Neobacillus ginsengisoli TaxID=904295 RepID=A0ABT9XVZ7_9BACI|nr:hypothetical protein [Neobacillus ginsengisoli]MDQ0199745.1 hypothetical protein [Neobacillus ginsengisoli]